MWGNGLYSPKWISTTYTMLDLRSFEVDPTLTCYQKSAELLLVKLWARHETESDYVLDLCICGMLLSLACYAKLQHKNINKIVDTLLKYHMKDGAWNCELKHHPHHSSVHTTINVLEGLLTYKQNGYTYRLDEIDKKTKAAHAFILCHKLYRSDKTDAVINKAFTMLSYPPRWKYDVLRALVYFANSHTPYDARMQDALDVVKGKRRKDGTWPVQQKYSGRTYFDYEKTGGVSRINTYRAQLVLKYFGQLETGN